MRLVRANADEQGAVDATVDEGSNTGGRGAVRRVGLTRVGPLVNVPHGSVDAALDVRVDHELDRPANAVVSRVYFAPLGLCSRDSVLPSGFDLQVPQVKNRDRPRSA